MTLARRVGGFTLLSSLVIGGLAVAHTDDPKATTVVRPYVGPGYRADDLNPLASVGLFDAHNVTLQSWMTLAEFGESSTANDCWGYTSPSGREYAILCLEQAGTAFVEITNPGSPQLLDVFDGNDSTWRDIKVFQDYAYVVTENNGGIQVFDMTDIDNGNISLADTIMTGGSGASHNVALNEASGRLYRCGGDGNGLRIYDLNADPLSPTYVGEWQSRYVHDAQIFTFTSGPNAGKEIAFCCSGFSSGWVETGLDVLDVTDPTDVQELGRIVYPNGVYSHQGWLSPDNKYFYLGDELDEGSNGIPTTTFLINVEDLTNPTYEGVFTNNSPAINHNMYTHGNLLFQANYTSGLRIFDACVSDAPVEVAYFDTRPEDDSVEYLGAWSNYPYFPSGAVIVSDRNRGLFVFTIDLPASGDLDGDGIIGFSDLVALLAGWGACDPGCCEADLDGDGQVGFGDVVALLANWS